MKKLVEKLEHLLELGGTKKDIALLAISGIALIVSLTGLELPFNAAWAAIILCGVPIILEAVIGLVTAFDIKADVLVSLALIASVCIGEDFAAGEVAFIMQLGGLLEELTVAKARAGIEKLVHLTPRTARVMTDAGEKTIPAEQVKIGDRLRVLPGETVPVDGVILSGQTAINQAVMTGESLPADRWATWIVVIALTAAALTWAVSGEIIRAVTILVVFCPCALVLATPTAIMAAIGNATKHGFLVREGDALERLAKVGVMTFDKTGTLTRGVPEVVEVQGDVFAACAAAEQFSEHPLGRAVVRCYKQQTGKAVPEATEFSMVPGRGVSARVDGKNVLAGNGAMMEEHDVILPQAMRAAAEKAREQGQTVIFVAKDNQAAGYIVLADTLRKESAAMIERLKAIGVRPVLLTGDHEAAANAIASRLGIDEVRASCMPEDKLAAIDALQQKGEAVCMIGDGVNDAPALKKANVGIAMGGVGSDIAVDAADIALVDDEVKELPHLMALSKRMMKTIKLNLTFSMSLNFLAITLAITGVLGPVVGALVHNAGSVLVITNSALLLGWKQK